MTSTSANLLRISHTSDAGEVYALLDPIGAGLHALHVNGRDVMPLDTELARTRWFSGHTLAPWPNRMRDGEWVFEGATLSAPLNDGLGNALHGVVGNREFEIVQRSDDSVRFEISLGDDPVYPFAVRVHVTFTVAADGLTCAFGARNESASTVPFAIGTHPYFPFDDDCTLTINADNAFEVDDRLIPSGRLMDLSAWHAQPGEPIALSTFVADDCFTSLRRDVDGIAHTLITHGDGAIVDVWQDAGLPHTVIFTTREFTWSDGGTKAIAIEPQTAPTNAFNSGIDLTWLVPGDDFVVRWGVAVSTAGR